VPLQQFNNFELKNLLRLNLSDTNVCSGFFAIISKECSKLRHLNISHCENLMTDMALHIISHIQTLTYLNIEGCYSISEAGLRSISMLPLTYLNMEGSGWTLPPSPCLRSIAKITTLQFLNMNHCFRDATDEDFLPMGELTSLRGLKMEGFGKLTDESLAVISKMVYLRRLNILSCEGFTDKGMPHLAKMKMACLSNLKSNIKAGYW